MPDLFYEVASVFCSRTRRKGADKAHRAKRKAKRQAKKKNR
jgi:hypothetical protein